ncbi:MAG: DUF1592 domain-containing protein [Planctomycetes bacterium]|nr:DUF1592 domain-containing protein [Planctomycetota bacterium]
MSRFSPTLVGRSVVYRALAALFCASAWLSGSMPVEAAGPSLGPIPGFLQKHCVACHGDDQPKAGLALGGIRGHGQILKARKVWENLADMVEAELMPPEDKPQPAPAEREAFLVAVRGIFDHYDRTAKTDPGRVTMRRLNKAEYDNTVRDLFYGTDFNASENFPSDDVGHGFDNIGDVLTMSPVLMERYLAAAEMIARKVVLTELPKPTLRRFDAKNLRPYRRDNVDKNDYRAFTNDEDAKGGDSGPVWHELALSPNDAFDFVVLAYGDRSDKKPVKLALYVAGDQLPAPSGKSELDKLAGKALQQVGPLRILKIVEVKSRDSKKPDRIALPMAPQPGVGKIGVALLKPEKGEPDSKVYLRMFGVEGPRDVRPYVMRRFMESDASKPVAEQNREILNRFASRAYRRPATAAEVDRMLALVTSVQADGGSREQGLQLAIQAVLANPKFVFRAELDDRPTAPDARAIDDYQLASRLSYFLWSSMPDDELFALAAKGELTKNLESQVRRMLKDPKSSALIDQFAMQWLQLGRLTAHAPDATMFPEFKEPLRQAMLTETKLFLGEIMREDHSILDMLDSDYTYMNSSLAKLYGVYDTMGNGSGRKKIPGGKSFRGDAIFDRVTLTDGLRGGLLTQPGILTVTSNPTRTSPVKRGKWVLEQMLGEPPPPPPPDVPELEQQKGKLTGSLRQQMEQHRADPACANCHAKMDQLGFAFENFNAVGAFREKDGNDVINPSGVLDGDKKFSGPAELRKILIGRKDDFAKCLTEKLLIFALGRGLEYYDDRAVTRIVEALQKNDYKFSTLCLEIVRSEPFRMRRGSEELASGEE